MSRWQHLNHWVTGLNSATVSIQIWLTSPHCWAVPLTGARPVSVHSSWLSAEQEEGLCRGPPETDIRSLVLKTPQKQELSGPS